MSLIHPISDEHSRLRRFTLYLFARYLELPLLGAAFELLRGRYRLLGGNRLLRKILGALLAKPFGLIGDTARPCDLEQALKLVDDLDGPIAVGPCRCRIVHRACDHPLETDIVIKTGHEAWKNAFPADYRTISKDEAKGIISDCHSQGLWQMVFIHCPVNLENEYVICNCCTCGCVPYIINRELGQETYPFLRGSRSSSVNLERCSGDGACVRACPFEVREIFGGKSRLTSDCFGCGRCVSSCPEGALEMIGELDDHEH